LLSFVILQRRRNRLSAQAHRDRQKRHVAELTSALQTIAEENQELKRNVFVLQEANLALQNRVDFLESTLKNSYVPVVAVPPNHIC